jgi:bifunctional non-homologous end joining protein LigD
VHEKGWYQTNCRGPDWMPVATVPGRRGDTFRMCLVNDERALMWVVNQGTVEVHPFLSAADTPDNPLALVFDFDPGPPAGLIQACAVALDVRARLALDGLVGVAKSSGSSGLHVYVGLDGSHSFAESKAYARGIARELVAQAPDRVTDGFRYAERTGRVLIDWRQNEWARSTVAPYSLRATPWPSVSTPLRWDEVERIAASDDSGPFVFPPAVVQERIDRDGDLFAAVLQDRQRLPVVTSDVQSPP